MPAADWAAAFSARPRGATTNPFFHPNPGEPAAEPAASTADLARLPDALRRLYAPWSRDAEFVHPAGPVLLSLAEVDERARHLPDGCTDLGFVYAGMGHVRVWTHVAPRDGIVELADGGACGVSRSHNQAARRDALARLCDGENADDAPPVRPVDEWLRTALA
jgi:hypothetical protein